MNYPRLNRTPAFLIYSALVWLAACTYVSPLRTEISPGLGTRSLRRIAVLAGAWGTSAEIEVIPLLKIVPDVLLTGGMSGVCSYRDVLLAISDPHIDLSLPEISSPGAYTLSDALGRGCLSGSTGSAGPLDYRWHERLDPVLAESLGKRLGVDAVCVMWLPSCSSEGGVRILGQIFATSDGAAVGEFSDSRTGWHYAGTDLLGASYHFDPEASMRVMVSEALPLFRNLLRTP